MSMPSPPRPDALADTAEAAPDTMAGPTHPPRLRLHPITPDERRANPAGGKARRIVWPVPLDDRRSWGRFVGAIAAFFCGGAYR
jgi:hypothetical protein